MISALLFRYAHLATNLDRDKKRHFRFEDRLVSYFLGFLIADGLSDFSVVYGLISSVHLTPKSYSQFAICLLVMIGEYEFYVRSRRATEPQ